MIIANYSHRSLIIRSIPTFLAKTDIRDNRIYIGNKYVTVFQDKNAKNPFKLGFNLNAGNAYYVLGEEILCKKPCFVDFKDDNSIDNFLSNI